MKNYVQPRLVAIIAFIASVFGPAFLVPPVLQAAATEAKVGIYIMNVYDMNMTSNSFYADFYLWMKWKGEVNPTKGISFANLVEQGSFIITPLSDRDSLLADGHYYQSFRIEGRFFNPFDVTNFPLDRQHLRLVLENDMYNREQLVYQLDDSPSGIDPSVIISGWRILGLDVSTHVKSYNTDFGLGNVNHGESFSSLTFEVDIQRPFNFFVWKLLFPLLIIMASGIAFMFLEPNEFATRLSLPVYAMLTAVFMQMGYSAVIPETGYLVLMDRIYVAAYALIIENMIQVIVMYRLYVADNSRLEALHRWDRRLAIGASAAFAIYIVAAVAMVYGTLK